MDDIDTASLPQVPGTPIPTEPVLFMKAVTALSGPFDDVITPRGSSELDYEVELAIVIGRTSQFMTLEPGDLIYAGTPAGVGAPPQS